jgi:DNA-binding FrmR family transcriptional regulator
MDMKKTRQAATKTYSHPHHADVVKRLARIQGHVNAVKTMVEEERECSDILQQVSAVLSALEKVRVILVGDHLEHCIVPKMGRRKGEAVVSEIKTVIGKL